MTKRKKPLTKMQKAWIAALRSGRYKQGRGLLTRKTRSRTTYCCIGVACCVVQDMVGGLRMETTDTEVWYDGKVGKAPESVMKAIGLRGPYGAIYRGSSLVMMNETGKTFDEIADIIQSRPEGLFV